MLLRRGGLISTPLRLQALVDQYMAQIVELKGSWIYLGYVGQVVAVNVWRAKVDSKIACYAVMQKSRFYIGFRILATPKEHGN
jgi:hypothetical protein